MTTLGSVYLSASTLNKLSIQDDSGHFELFKVCTQEATSMINSGGILIGTFTTSYDYLVATPVSGDRLKYPIRLNDINDAFANNILMDTPGVLVSSSDRSKLKHVIAINIDHTGKATFLGTMNDNNEKPIVLPLSDIASSVTRTHSSSSDSVASDILKRIACGTQTGKRKSKCSLSLVFFGDKVLKPRAANDAAHMWIDHHGKGFAKIDLVRQRGTVDNGHNFMRRFQIYRKDKWVTIKTLHECLNLVMEHSGRDFYADMKDSPDSYPLSFKPSQFVSHTSSNAVNVIDDEGDTFVVDMCTVK